MVRHRPLVCGGAADCAVATSQPNNSQPQSSQPNSLQLESWQTNSSQLSRSQTNRSQPKDWHVDQAEGTYRDKPTKMIHTDTAGTPMEVQNLYSCLASSA